MEYINYDLNLIIGDGDLVYSLNQKLKQVKILWMEKKISDIDFIQILKTLKEQIELVNKHQFELRIDNLIECVSTIMDVKEEHKAFLKEQLKRKK